MSDHRDTLVVREGGSGVGVILGVIALVIVLAAAWYLLLGPGAGGSDRPSDVNVNVELPSVAPGAS
jgi:hypothetical protein